jgi:hypothetical protein
MNYLKYALIGLGVLVLISAIVAMFYWISYFREQSATLKLQNDAASELKKPSISLDGVSCNIASDAKTQSYSIVIRTSSPAIDSKQQQIEDRIKTLGGTIASASQGKIYDQDAGYGNSATINASLPLAKAGTLISQIKSDLVSPDYAEDENNSIQDSAMLRQTCEYNLDSLKNLASTETLYLSQLSSGQITTPTSPSYPSPSYPVHPVPPPSPYPPSPPPPSVSPSPYYSSEGYGSVIQNLINIRQNAHGLRNGIESIMGQLNKTQITVSIKEIPG